MDARGRHPQLEIGPRRAQPQAIGILRAAVALGVAQTHVIDAVGRQREADQGIGVVRSQVVELVFMVVVEGQTLAGGVEQLQDAVQRRFQPAGGNLRHDLLAGAAFETEHVPVAGPVDPPVDDHGQRDRLGGLRRIVGLLCRGIPAACPRTNGIVLEIISPLLTESGWSPGVMSLASIVSVSVGRFQPESLTVVAAPAGPPSGKMPVM